MIQLSLEQGQRLKREGQQKIDSRNKRFIYDMRVYARAMSDMFGKVTTDDLRRHATGLGEYPTHHNAWGCIFKQKGWTVIGRQPSKLPGNHARSIAVWKWEGV